MKRKDETLKIVKMKVTDLINYRTKECERKYW